MKNTGIIDGKYSSNVEGSHHLQNTPPPCLSCKQPSDMHIRDQNYK